MSARPTRAHWSWGKLSSDSETHAVYKRALVVNTVVSVLLSALPGVDSSRAQSSSSGTPNKPSSPPEPQVWARATLVTPTRKAGTRSADCQVQRIDHWLKVQCPKLATSAITQLGGSPDNVYFHLEPAAEDGLPRAGELVVRLEPSDRRVFSFWSLGEGYDGPLTIIASVIVQIEAGRIEAGQRQEPIVLLHDALHEPIRTAQSELRRQAMPQAQTTDVQTLGDHTAP